MICPSCSAHNDFIFCTSCNALLDNPAVQTYFDMYRTGGKLSLNAASLEADYFNLMKRVHPDKFASKGEAAHSTSLRYAELVNNGFKVLHNPFSRANYFAELFDLKEKSDAIPPEVMADVFEINELLEEDSLDDDQSEELDDYLDTFSAHRRRLQKELNALFEHYDRDQLSREEIKGDLNSILNKAAYFNRLVDRMMEKLDNE